MNQQIEKVGVATGEIMPMGSTPPVLNEAEVNLQVATAKRFPRSITKFTEEAMQLVTLDEATASSCFYTLPVAARILKVLA